MQLLLYNIEFTGAEAEMLIERPILMLQCCLTLELSYIFLFHSTFPTSFIHSTRKLVQKLAFIPVTHTCLDCSVLPYSMPHLVIT